jgi:hypothetical protein
MEPGPPLTTCALGDCVVGSDTGNVAAGEMVDVQLLKQLV